MFLPTSKEEMKKLGWDQPDVVLVSGDAYVDSPYIGVSVIGKVLCSRGYKVAIIPQPDVNSGKDITSLGEPRLFWGVSAGCVDSMVANYTASKKRKKHDDLTPGNLNTKRPDRACIAYTNLIRRHFKNTVPVVLGGLEASLRRIAHYDYWTDSIRKSVLFDAKADVLVYSMGERAITELARCLDENADWKHIRGICYADTKKPGDGFMELPPFALAKEDKGEFEKMFMTFYNNSDPKTAKGLYQLHTDRYLVHNPPAQNLDSEELGAIYNLDYERTAPPCELEKGPIRALDTIRFSVTTHRGCYGECNFCSIAVHQGTTVVSRTKESILEEVKQITRLKGFSGIITDLGGPTANMYEIECAKKQKSGSCARKKCLFPKICPNMPVNHSKQIDLLKTITALPGVKKVFVSSGIRHDMVMADRKSGPRYLDAIVKNHTGGQLKLAPEHVCDRVLAQMGKPGTHTLEAFIKEFEHLNRAKGKQQFLTYYFIAAHPGCSLSNMQTLKDFVSHKLKINPEQVQIFTPTPSTISTLMYWTGKNPFTGQKVFSEKDQNKKDLQKSILTSAKKILPHKPLAKKPLKKHGKKPFRKKRKF